MYQCGVCGADYNLVGLHTCGGERSEPPPALDTFKDKWYNAGAGLSSSCPREGSILLESWKQKRVLVNTNCNSWRCVACRDRNRARFKAMVASGISHLTRSCFITITYRADAERLHIVGCVARDWKALWRLLRKNEPWLSPLPKLRVMELTKKGTPHFHLVIGNIPSEKRLRCFGRNFDVVRYRLVFDDCPCVAHVIGRAWQQVQDGESWLVHAVPVAGAKGAASYMAKYLDKEFDGARGEALGMKRRWSTSRNWPSEKRSRLTESLKPAGWRRTVWAARKVLIEELTIDEELLARKETERQKAEARRAVRRRLVKQMEVGKHGN